MEDIRYSADGPETKSFVFRNDGIMCGVNGGAHSWIEDGKILTSERYDLEAWCASSLDRTAPGH